MPLSTYQSCSLLPVLLLKFENSISISAGTIGYCPLLLIPNHHHDGHLRKSHPIPHVVIRFDSSAVAGCALLRTKSPTPNN